MEEVGNSFPLCASNSARTGTESDAVMSLFLNEPYLDRVSQEIAELGAANGMLGESLAFIRSRKSVDQFRAFVRGEKRLRRSMRGAARPKWASAL